MTITEQITGAQLEPQRDMGLPVLNMTDVETREIFDNFDDQARSLIAAFSEWAGYTNGAGSGRAARNGGIFQRDRYVTPSCIREQMTVAYAAVEQDDIVANVAETTEALAFSLVSFFAEDEDEQDVYNQIAADLDLDSRLREIWRELFTVSQVYVAVWWDRKSYTVRGKTDKGNQKRKTFDVMAPTSITLLDPLKVVPVGTTMFGKERLAYCANRTEDRQFQDIISSQRDRVSQDEIVSRLIVEKYDPSPAEKKELTEAGFDCNNLWLLNPNNVFRHTLTRSSFQRWAPVRLRSVFELLDAKQQLRQSERAHLIGATNFIVLVTKGSDKIPARPDEIEHLKSQVRTAARIPILVGDHRLSVEIVTPKLDFSLKAERWNTIDSRLTARLFQMFQLGNYAAGAAGDDSGKLIKVVARSMESRRHMIRRTLEREILKPMFDMNDELKTEPKLLFHPRAIALDFDQAWSSFLLQLRQDREISRDTILSQFDLDQAHEHMMIKREADKYDDDFKTKVAFSGPGDPKGPFDPATGLPVKPGAKPGAQPAPAPGDPANHIDNGGGNRNGGGAAPGTGQGQPARNPQKKSDPKRKTQQKVAAHRVTVVDGDGNVVAEGEPIPGVDVSALLVDGHVAEGEPDGT